MPAALPRAILSQRRCSANTRRVLESQARGLCKRYVPSPLLGVRRRESLREGPARNCAAHRIEAIAAGPILRGEVETLKVWLDELPSDLMQARPFLSVICAWTYHMAGQRGDGRRESISWDEALDLAAESLQQVHDGADPEAVWFHKGSGRDLSGGMCAPTFIAWPISSGRSKCRALSMSAMAPAP
jgi:hypothetical protein